MKELSRRMFLGSAAIGSVATLSTGISGTAQAKEVKKEKPWDVIVVGAGTAGIVCAITAHDLGARVCA